MANILIIGSAATLSSPAALVEAVALGAELAKAGGDVVLGGFLGSNVAEGVDLLKGAGVSRVLTVEDDRLASYTGDMTLAAAVALVQASGAEIVIVPTDADAVEWVPRLAARLSAALATNCNGARMDGATLVVTRSVAGGVLRADYRLETPVKLLLTVAGLDLPAVAPAANCSVEALTLGGVDSRIELLEFVPEDAGSGPALKSARIVVSGGMGIGSADNWHIVEEAAQAVGGAVGATRAAVEAGWVPAARQVGFSGLKVGPDLYIAAGISGALHHLAGIGRAKKVVAINSDPEAGIFKASHLGVVGDVAEVLPAFTARIRELQGQ